MKRFTLTLLLFAASVSTFGRAWYVTAAGNDLLAGNTPGTAWKTLAKVKQMFSTFLPGDSILLNRGELFFGDIVVAKSGTAGAPIVIGAYGSGAIPIISGLFTTAGWTTNFNGTWKTSTLAKYNCNYVELNGVPQVMGRWPNIDSVIGNNIGMMTLESFNSNLSFTDNQLPLSPNWKGAKVVIAKDGFIREKDSVLDQIGTTIYNDAGVTVNPRNGPSKSEPIKKAGWGYFIFDDPRTLDQFGEWFVNKTTGELLMYFGSALPSSYTIKLAAVDTLINVKNFNYIKIENIAFEGSNLCGVYSQDNNTLTVKNCSFNGSGAKGVFIWNAPNITIDGCNFNNMTSNAIDITGRYVSGAVVTNNTIDSTGVIPGMGDLHNDPSGKAIYVDIKANGLIRGNRITKTGYTAIQYQGDDILIEKNFIDTFCFEKCDGGGIYTYAGGYRTNRVVRYNIVLNGIGSTNGNMNPRHAEGWYSDGFASGTDVYGNYIANISNHGIYINDGKRINVYDNLVVSSIGVGVSKHYKDSIYALRITRNTFWDYKYSSGNGQIYYNEALNSPNPPLAATINQAMSQAGTIDSNIYNITPAVPKPLYWYWFNSQGGAQNFPASTDFAGWRAASGQDAHSTQASGASWMKDHNATDSPRLITYSGRRKTTPDGTIYDNGYILQPWTGVVLIDLGPISVNDKLILNGYIFK